MLSTQQETSLASASQAAIAAERTTGCPRELSVAQWALESSWGAKQPENNCFGIKVYAGCYGVQLLMTDEWFTSLEFERWRAGHPTLKYIGPARGVNSKGRSPYKLQDEFATFPTLEACFEYHGKLIATGARYRAAWDNYERDLDLDGLIEDISKVYATDPGYAKKLRVILRMPQVVEALHA